MYIITFYSFKGVGRTLALVNVAAELARRGRRVLVVDFDLEAPALDTARLLRPSAPHPGVVEYVTRYVATGEEPAVGGYLYHAGPVGTEGGNIWVMPAGRRDAEYALSLARLDWLDLYQARDGFGLLNRLKAQWEDLLHPDYVLIDCRGGRTHVEGICTRQLPDAVVALFFPDTQNLTGLAPVCGVIRTETERGRPEPITLHLVASNVPPDDEGTGRDIQEKGSRVPELGGWLAGVLHRQGGLVTLDGPPVVLDRPSTRLAGEYRELVSALIAHNVADLDGAVAFLAEMGGELDEEEEARLDRFRDRHRDNVPFLVVLAGCLIKGGRFPDAERVLDRVLEDLQPGFRPALIERARCRRLRQDRVGAVEDVQAILGHPGLDDDEVRAAFQVLYAVAPERFDDFRKAPEARIWLVDGEGECDYEAFFGAGLWQSSIEWKQGLGRLDRLRFEVLCSPDDPASIAFWRLPEEVRLQRIKKYAERIRRLELGRRNLPDGSDEHLRQWMTFHIAYDHFDLARALWAATTLLPADLCARGLAYHAEVDAGFTNLSGERVKESPLYRQLVALALWAAGRAREAREEIARAEECALADPPEREYVSPFREYADIRREQLLQDCHLIADLIRGVPNVQPASP